MNADQYGAAIRGTAAIAQTAAEMGEPDDEVLNTIRGWMAHLGLTRRVDALNIAEAVRRIPQPLVRSAAEEARCRPIEDLVGLTPAEDQLAAQLRAREPALLVADELPA